MDDFSPFTWCVFVFRMLPEFAAAVRAGLPVGKLSDTDAALTSCLCLTLEPLTPFGVSFALARSESEDASPRKEWSLSTLMSRLCVRSFEMLLLLRRNLVGTDGHISGQVSVVYTVTCDIALKSLFGV